MRLRQPKRRRRRQRYRRRCHRGYYFLLGRYQSHYKSDHLLKSVMAQYHHHCCLSCLHYHYSSCCYCCYHRRHRCCYCLGHYRSYRCHLGHCRLFRLLCHWCPGRWGWGWGSASDLASGVAAYFFTQCRWANLCSEGTGLADYSATYYPSPRNHSTHWPVDSTISGTYCSTIPGTASSSPSTIPKAAASTSCRWCTMRRTRSSHPGSRSR